MKKNSKKIGDEGEKFVAEYLRNKGFLTEIHPRTFRLLHLPGGKVIQISKDNDFYNLFDIKAECDGYMLYIQVKVEKSKANTSSAQKNIDVYFPYEFPYQRIQTWMLWKEWINTDENKRKHKEYKYIIQERRGFSNSLWTYEGNKYKKGNWVLVNANDINSNF